MKNSVTDEEESSKRYPISTKLVDKRSCLRSIVTRQKYHNRSGLVGYIILHHLRPLIWLTDLSLSEKRFWGFAQRLSARPGKISADPCPLVTGVTQLGVGWQMDQSRGDCLTPSLTPRTWCNRGWAKVVSCLSANDFSWLTNILQCSRI